MQMRSQDGDHHTAHKPQSIHASAANSHHHMSPVCKPPFCDSNPWCWYLPTCASCPYACSSSMHSMHIVPCAHVSTPAIHAHGWEVLMLMSTMLAVFWTTAVPMSMSLHALSLPLPSPACYKSQLSYLHIHHRFCRKSSGTICRGMLHIPCYEIDKHTTIYSFISLFLQSIHNFHS